MPQHDMNLANADGATFRADANNALLALVGNNDGATAPTTTFAYMWWADTTTGLLKQRNAANSAWITIGTLASANLGHALLTANTFTGLQNWAAGADIASAATVDLTAATGNSPRITGTTATSAVTMNTGQICLVVADGAWPLTYHATTNKISGGASYTLAAGDQVLYHKDLSGIVHGFIMKADGTAVVSSGVLYSDARFKAISVTRDVSVTGTQTVTGAGFTPKACIILAVIANTIAASWGMCDDATNYALNHDQPTADNAFSFQNNSVFLFVSSGNYAQASMAFNSDGGVLTWSKTGSPTGTATVRILFIR